MTTTTTTFLLTVWALVAAGPFGTGLTRASVAPVAVGKEQREFDYFAGAAVARHHLLLHSPLLCCQRLLPTGCGRTTMMGPGRRATATPASTWTRCLGWRRRRWSTGSSFSTACVLFINHCLRVAHVKHITIKFKSSVKTRWKHALAGKCSRRCHTYILAHTTFFVAVRPSSPPPTPLHGMRIL